MARKAEPSRSGEFDLIARFFAPLAGEEAFDLRDDAALLKCRPGHDLVMTQDAIFQGVHFFDDEPLDFVGRRALRVNVSDLVAKGATPLTYSLALGVPDWMTDEHFEALAQGLQEDQNHYAITLSGGDTYRTDGKLALAVTMIGELKQGRYVSRLGAKADDLVAVSGTIGDAALGLNLRQHKARIDDDIDRQWLVNRQQLPSPPNGLQSVINDFATASMDVSDGLVGDLGKLCRASGVGAELEEADIPQSPQAMAFLNQHPDKQRLDLRKEMLTGGDDYQVLFTVSPKQWEECRKAAEDKSISTTIIGKILPDVDAGVVVRRDGVPWSFATDSYSHF